MNWIFTWWRAGVWCISDRGFGRGKQGGEGSPGQSVAGGRWIRHGDQSESGGGCRPQMQEQGVVCGYSCVGNSRCDWVDWRAILWCGVGKTGWTAFNRYECERQSASAKFQFESAQLHVCFQRPLPGRHDRSLSLPHAGILPLQQVREPDIQLQPPEPGWPQPKQDVCEAVARYVPQKCGRQNSHRHGPHNPKAIRQCLLQEPHPRKRPLHLGSGALHGFKIPGHRPILGLQPQSL